MSEVDYIKFPLVSLKCDWCALRFGGIAGYRSHVVAKHNISRDVTFTFDNQAKHRCRLCDTSVSLLSANFKQHLRQAHKNWTIKIYLQQYYADIEREYLERVQRDRASQQLANPTSVIAHADPPEAALLSQVTNQEATCRCDISNHTCGPGRSCIIQGSNGGSIDWMSEYQADPTCERDGNKPTTEPSEAEQQQIDDPKAEFDFVSVADSDSIDKPNVSIEKGAGDSYLCPHCSPFGVTFQSEAAAKAHMKRQHLPKQTKRA